MKIGSAIDPPKLQTSVAELNSYNNYILKIRIATALSNYESFLENSLDTFKKDNNLAKNAVVKVYKKADASTESSEPEDVLLSDNHPKMSDFIETCIEDEKKKYE